MVREHEVFAAGVEVDVVAEELSRHGGALDVPAGPAGTKRRLPELLTGFGGLPQREVAGRILLVLIHIDPGAVFDSLEVLLRELAVAGKARDTEVPASILGAIGDVFGCELFDHPDHLRNAAGGVRDVLRVLDRKRVEVFVEGLLVFLCVLRDGEAGRRCIADDLVVDVGDVHHMIDGDSLLADKAAQYIDMEKGAKVADVAVVIDRRAAAVHAQRGWTHRGQGFNRSTEGVVEFDGCHVLSVPVAAGRVARRRLLLSGIPDDFSRKTEALCQAFGLSIPKAKLWCRTEVFGCKILCYKFGPRGGGDHGSVVGRERERRKGDRQPTAVGFGLKPAAQLAVGRDSARDDDAVGAERFGRRKGLAQQVADHRVLERGEEVKRLPIAKRYCGWGFRRKRRIGGQSDASGLDALARGMRLDVPEDSGLDAAEGEVEVRALRVSGGFLVRDAFARRTA